MLPYSRKPEIIRVHNLEEGERRRYVGEAIRVGFDCLPSKVQHVIPFLGDLFYTYVSIVACDRRLGEEYTYVAKYKEKHYEEEGVLLNSKFRVFIVVGELLQRHAVKKLLKKGLDKLDENPQVKKWKDMVLGDAETVVGNGRWFMLMLFMLGVNPYFNLLDTLLGIRYIYAFRNKNTAKVSYRVEGWLLFAVFFVKALRVVFSIIDCIHQKEDSAPSQPISRKKSHEQQSEEELCRICYDQIQDKSSTVCGHIFCWSCIMSYVNQTHQCPVCRTECSPREIVQLQNF